MKPEIIQKPLVSTTKEKLNEEEIALEFE